MGFQVGQRGGTISSWNKPLAKFEKLTAELSALGIAASQGTDSYNNKIASKTSYVEQLCPPSPKYVKLELPAIAKTLHCPHNCLPRDAAYLLDHAGMRKFVSVELRAQAAQARTAFKTCNCWKKELDSLNEVRKEYGPLANQAHTSRLIDYSWRDTEAFADVLMQASVGGVLLASLNPSCTEARAKTVSAKSMQAGIHKTLFAARFPFDLACVLLPRILKHVGNAYEETVFLEAMRRTLRCVKKMAPRAGWALVRTWRNAWSTSVGLDRKLCIFGCDHSEPRGHPTANEDSLKHYLVCPSLWGPIVQFSSDE